MFGAIATGESTVRTPLRGEDCESTLRCLAQLGLRFEWLSDSEVKLMPPREWTQPDGPLDCGNSGTTMRLIAGLLASRPLDVIMIGDGSLSRRPMKRIAIPLRQMGATVEGDTPPIHIAGAELRGICYDSPVASAQVKSCVLLAGLGAQGWTSVTEPAKSRDHTERMLRALGASIAFDNYEASQEEAFGDKAIMADLAARNGVLLKPGKKLHGFEFAVPGDISSAAFLLVAGALFEGSATTATDLNTNPTRTGLLDVLRQAGLEVAIEKERDELGEPVADVTVQRRGPLSPFTIEGQLVPRLIDEIPVLAVLATQCAGTSVIKDATELRVKESDRIEVMAEGLRRMGAQVETFADGMAITGPTPLNGIQIDAKHDHRIAMSFAVAGLIAEGQTVIDGADSIATSYPAFEGDLRSLANV